MRSNSRQNPRTSWSKCLAAPRKKSGPSRTMALVVGDEHEHARWRYPFGDCGERRRLVRFGVRRTDGPYRAGKIAPRPTCRCSVSQPPYGFVEFCQRMPEECKAGTAGGAALLGDAGAPERTARNQPSGQPRDHTRHGPGNLRPDRNTGPSRPRGAIAKILPSSSASACWPRLADERAADHGGA